MGKNEDLEKRVKILLADDSVTMHRAVSLGLRNEPFDVVTCDNGEDALRIALAEKPDIVLADLDMPGLTGIELLSAIRKESSLARVRVVLLCGSFDQVDEGRLDGVDADGRLWKPFEAQALVALVNTLLKRGPRESADPTGQSPAAVASVTEPSDLRSASEATDDLSELADQTFREVEQDDAGISGELPRQSAEATDLNLNLEASASSETAELSVESQPDDGGSSPTADLGDLADLPKFPDPSTEDDDLPTVDERQAAQSLWNDDASAEGGEASDIVFPDDSFAPAPNIDRALKSAFGDSPAPDQNQQASGASDYADESEEGSDQFQIVTPDSWEQNSSNAENLQHEVLGDDETSPSLDADEPPQEQQSERPALTSATDPEIDFSSFHEEAQIEERVAAAAMASGLSEAEIRAVVRDEIKASFSGWLKQALEAELDRVVGQLQHED